MSEAASSPAPVPLVYSPAALFGAATPLWGYFAGAALTGVALWWMSRWIPGNAAEATQPAAEAANSAAEASAEPVPGSLASPFEEVSVELELPASPVGGEAAPIPPLAAISSPAEDTPPPVLEAAPPAPKAPRAPRPRRPREDDAKPH